MVDPRFPLTHRVPLYSLGLDLSLHLLHHPTCDLPVVVACSHVGVVCHCLSGPTHRRPRALVRNAECVRHLPLLEARWVQFRNLAPLPLKFDLIPPPPLPSCHLGILCHIEPVLIIVLLNHFCNPTSLCSHYSLPTLEPRPPSRHPCNASPLSNASIDTTTANTEHHNEPSH